MSFPLTCSGDAQPLCHSPILTHSIRARQPQPIHALEIIRINRAALAGDDDAALFCQAYGHPPDRLHQRTPAIRMVATDGAGGIGWTERLVQAARRDEAEDDLFDGLKISGNGRVHGWRVAVFAADVKGCKNR